MLAICVRAPMLGILEYDLFAREIKTQHHKTGFNFVKFRFTRDLRVSLSPLENYF